MAGHEAERKTPSAGQAVGRRLLVSTNSGHVLVADPVAAFVRNRHCERLVSPPDDGWSALVSGSPTTDGWAAACLLADPPTPG